MYKFLVLLFIGLLSTTVNAQNNTCADAAPFCTGTVFNFPAGVDAGNAEPGPDYGCLGSEPNPAWYFMQVEDPGDISIFMVGTDNAQQTPSNDIDFICYGPFNSIQGVCGQLTADNIVDCSYSALPTETVSIPNAQEGEIYLLMITNFSNDPCNIIFSQNGGTGSTSCGPFNNGPLCVGNTLELTSLYSPNEFNFTWTGPNGFVSNDPEPIIENVTLDMAGEYVLIVENPVASDTASTIVEISLPPEPPVITAQDSAICNGEFTFLNVEGDYASYDWPSIGQSNQQVEVGPGTYEVIVNAVLGCSATASFTVEVAPTIEPVIIAPDSLCGAATADIYTTEQFDTYQWTTGSSNDTITVGPGFYAVNVTLEGFCNASSEPVQILESSTITPVIFGPDHTCFDFIVPLQTTEEFVSYEWSTGSVTDTILVNQGTFTVSVTDEFGCTGTSLPFIVSNSAPQAEVFGITDFCEGDSILVNAAPNFAAYEWTNALFETLSTADTVWFAGDSLYLKVTDEFGCFNSDLFIILPTPLPGANFTANPSLTYIQLPAATISYADNSQPATGDSLIFWNYLVEPLDGDWVPGDGQDSVFFDTPDGSVTITYPDTGFYTVTMLTISQLGCVDTVQYTIYVFDEPYVPNAISPNGDGVNDFLKIPFLSGYPENEVYIYNRWGKRVYEATNYKDDWAAENLPSGTYFYVVTAPTLEKPLKGSLNVFKED